MWTFYYISRNVHEIQNTLKKKEEYPSQIITEIIASERHVYLSF